MAFIERKKYGSRVGGAIVGSLFGIIFFFGSFVLIGWNERDAIRQKAAISELEKVALPNVDSQTINPENDSKLVHMNGDAITEEVLQFQDFAVAENAIRLEWKASIYQWKETKKEEDDRTVYSYNKKWVDKPISSSGFRRSGNPGEKHYNGEGVQKFHDGSVQASKVDFGAFLLPSDLVKEIDKKEKHFLDGDTVTDIFPEGQVSEGVFYTGNPGNPNIGDEKVEVFVVGPKHAVTVMSKQSGNTFTPYLTKNGISKQILYLGTLTKEEVIKKQRFAAAVKRWLIRVGGFFAMWIGLGLVFKPLRAIVSFIPFASQLLGGAIGFVTFFITFALSLLTIAISWFAVRPIMSGFLLAVAAICFVLVARAKSKNDDSYASQKSAVVN